MSQANWEADKMLDVYIYDYLVKRKLHASAKAFQAEGKVSTDPVAINAPGGFLFEWWSVFWDIFIARTNDKHSEIAATYIETQIAKARELQGQQHPKPQSQSPQQQQHHQQQQQQQQQLQMQQMLYQRHAQQQQQQQQRREGSSDALLRQNPATANALATKMYEERLKLPLQRDSFDDTAMKQMISDNVGQLLDPNHASMSKSPAVGGQPPGPTLHGAPAGISGNIQQVQNRNQQHPLSAQDIKSEMSSMMSPMMSPRGREGSLIGPHGSSQAGNSLTLKGWPLTGLDQLRSGLLQPKSLMQSPQSFNQLQLQQQLMLQAQQNLTSPSANDLESRRLRMLLNNPNVGSPLQLPVLPRGDTDMLLKFQQQQLQNSNQQQQQYMQHPLSSQQSRNSNSHHQQQDKLTASGGMTGDGSMSNTYRGNDQAPKSQIGRKRKQALSSSGPANSSGTANTAGPCMSSPSSPSTHTPGDVISMPTIPHNSGGSSKSMLMFGSDGLEGSLASAPNQLADMDRFVDDGALEDTVESYLSHEDTEPRDRVGRPGDVSKGFTFAEFQVLPASTSKVECCHFSSDGKLLATGGHDKKAVLWCTETFSMKATLEEHSQWITDIRFSPSMSRLATSSADKTVRVWDADNPGYSLRNFTGHSSTVTSVDFHPNNEDLICSSDNNTEIRYWSIKNGSCAGVLKAAATQLRFQPRVGRFLAAASENYVSILDVEAQVCRQKLQGHRNKVQSICWDPCGDYLASVSDDMVRVWLLGSGSKADCIHELSCSGSKFHTCVFHPSCRSLMVIGCHEGMELWDMRENKTMTLHAHDEMISALAVSNVNGLVASASHDKYVKLWK